MRATLRCSPKDYFAVDIDRSKCLHATHQAQSFARTTLVTWFITNFHTVTFPIVQWGHVSGLITKPTKWLCTQQRLRSAWLSAQSDQSSLYAQWVAKLSSCGQRRLWSDCVYAQADPSLRWAYSHFVGFITRRLNVMLELCITSLLLTWHDLMH